MERQRQIPPIETPLEKELKDVTNPHFASFLQSVDRMIQPYGTNPIPEKEVICDIVRELEPSKKTNQLQLERMAVYYLRQISPLKAEKLYCPNYKKVPRSSRKQSFIDHQSLIFASTVWFQRAKYREENGTNYPVILQAIEDSADLWGESEKAVALRRAAANYKEKLNKADQKIEENAESGKKKIEEMKIELEEFYDLLKTCDLPYLEQKLESAKNVIRLDSLASRVEGLDWRKVGMDPRVWMALGYIFYAHRHTLSIFEGRKQESPTANELYASLKVAINYIKNHPDLFGNALDLYKAIKKVVEGDKKEYYFGGLAK